MAKLRVVALVSGGKDSLFSILHCLKQGHEVVALANLHPSPSEATAEDIDSFMYQTIGHTVIPLYEQALGLPLYREAIRGSARNTNKTYSVSTGEEGEEQDETESLVPLLQRVLEAHPDINALSSGAILSDYQRTRVESVAIRLGLTPLAYLWQYPRIVSRSPTSLLEDMSAVGQDARIIKVSSGGLDESFLWSNVADGRTISRLRQAAQRFGDLDNGATLGEGGEYETLAVDGPAPLWKGRIHVREQDMHILPGEAGSTAMRISGARVVLKSHASLLEYGLPLPDELEPTFVRLLDAMKRVSNPASENNRCNVSPSVKAMTSAETNRSILLADITAPGLDAARQTATAMASIKLQLNKAGHTIDDIAYTSIILRHMADFAMVNAAYKDFFKQPHPPARITLACASVLTEDSQVSLSVSSHKVDWPELRRGLHVQSISYWAPANIGPYSQAISLPISTPDGPSLVYVAGQIPMVPATLDLVDSEEGDAFLQQSVLSLQHLYRIGQAMVVQRWIHAIAFVVAKDHGEAANRAQVVRDIWHRAHAVIEIGNTVDEDDSDESFDVWDEQYARRRAAFRAESSHNESVSSDSAGIWMSPAPPLKVFQADSLPRQASVEWVAFGSTSAGSISWVVPHYRLITDTFANQAL